METEKVIDFCVSRTQRLADLVGIRADLHFVGVLVDSFLKYPGLPINIQSLYRNAFCFSAIVTYGRTFGTGVRENLPRSFIDRLNPEWIEAHEYFKDLRDKWIAHSTNNFEQSRVTLQVKFLDSGQAMPTLVSDGHSMTVSLSSTDMLRLKELSSLVLVELKREIEQEKLQVLEYAKTIDLTILLENPDAFARTAEPQRHDRPRSRFDG